MPPSKVQEHDMKLTLRDLLQLGALITVAALVGLLLRTERPLGQDVSASSLARAIGADRSSPAEDNPAADLTLIVFTDYRCPACRSAHPAMKRAVAKDGKVRIVYKDWPIFGDQSERAAQVAIASALQAIYPIVHDRLMTGRLGGDDALRAAVHASGGDWDRLLSDLASNQPEILAQIERNKKQASELGLGGTPGYLIGPMLVRGALNEAQFTRAFQQARKGLPNAALPKPWRSGSLPAKPIAYAISTSGLAVSLSPKIQIRTR